jgi:hypothetical protein
MDMKEKLLLALVSIALALFVCGCTQDNPNRYRENYSFTTTTFIENTVTTISGAITNPQETTTTFITQITLITNITNSTERKGCAYACAELYTEGYTGSYICYSNKPKSYCSNSTTLLNYMPAQNTNCPQNQLCWCALRENCQGKCSVGACTNSTV